MAHRQRSAGPGAATPRAPKTCASCGRGIEWRAKWARDWDAVRYCSDACRRRGVTATDQALEASILSLLSAESRGGANISATIDSTDAARQIGGDDWLRLREPARRAARRLVAAGEIEIVQSGSVVDPSTAKGPIRLRRVPK